MLGAQPVIEVASSGFIRPGRGNQWIGGGEAGGTVSTPVSYTHLHQRHHHVHDDNVRQSLCDHLDGLAAIFCFAYHFNVLFLIEQSPETLPDYGVIIYQQYRDPVSYTHLQISVPVQPGNSGGPLCDANGQVVGIVVARLNDLTVMQISGVVPQNVNYAVKARPMRQLLQNVKGLDLIAAQAQKPADPIKTVESAIAMVLIY